MALNYFVTLLTLGNFGQEVLEKEVEIIWRVCLTLLLEDTERVVWVDLLGGIDVGEIIKSSQAVGVDRIARTVLGDSLRIDGNVRGPIGSYIGQDVHLSFSLWSDDHAALLDWRTSGLSLEDMVLDTGCDVVDVLLDVLRDVVSLSNQYIYSEANMKRLTCPHQEYTCPLRNDHTRGIES